MKTILRNGKIYVEKNHLVEALLIEDGIIKNIGSNAEIAALQADDIIDLEGKTVLPGMNDSHMHLVGVGNAMSTCSLSNAKSIEEIILAGRDFLAANPGLRALPGRGWNQDNFTSGEKRMPTRFDLDQISTDIPICFTRVCGHMAISNTKAIELLGIDKDTRVDGGVIELDDDGVPNGIFCEKAIAYLRTVIPAANKEDMQNDFLKAARYAISLGITSVQSGDVNKENYPLMFEAIHELYDNKRTSLRYDPQINFHVLEDFAHYIDNEFQTGHYDRFMTKGALKLLVDGSLGARTALLLNDYNDAPGVRGVRVLSVEQLDGLCSLAAKNGIRIVTHAIGDGAIEMIVDAYEKVMVNGENPLRHGIVHCQITGRDLLERIARLNIPVMYQPIFLDYDSRIVEDRVGKELASTSYAFNTLFQLGVPISFGTDSPVENCNPWHNLYCAVTRMRLDGTPVGGYNPPEKMDLQDAIDCYTYGGAFNEFTEDYKGRLKPGFVADLVVLDRDIFTINPEEIKDITVEKTMINGSFVEQ